MMACSYLSSLGYRRKTNRAFYDPRADKGKYLHQISGCPGLGFWRLQKKKPHSSLSSLTTLFTICWTENSVKSVSWSEGRSQEDIYPEPYTVWNVQRGMSTHIQATNTHVHTHTLGFFLFFKTGGRLESRCRPQFMSFGCVVSANCINTHSYLYVLIFVGVACSAVMKWRVTVWRLNILEFTFAYEGALKSFSTFILYYINK